MQYSVVFWAQDLKFRHVLLDISNKAGVFVFLALFIMENFKPCIYYLLPIRVCERAGKRDGGRELEYFKANQKKSFLHCG